MIINILREDMYKYIQQDETILSWFLFQELYMFRAFTMPIIIDNRWYSILV
jgi:hypothetical protein